MGGVWGGGLSRLLAQAAPAPDWDPAKPLRALGQPLRVQPVFMYRLPVRKEASSWKSWGGIQSAAAVTEELQRINQEGEALVAAAGFPLEWRKVLPVDTPEAAAALAQRDHDVTVLYACTGSGDLLQRCLAARPDNLVFVRHQSGPVYYWYEALSVRYLQTGGTLDPAKPNLHVDDVVVDEREELTWRLRALFGVKNLRVTRVVALGGAWGKYAPDAPRRSQERFGFDLREVSYTEFEPRLKAARADARLQAQAAAWTDAYLRLPRTVLKTDRQFVTNAFLLYHLFQALLREHEATAFTIKSCMGTIIPMSETTACLTLALMNDEGSMAFCESDFVIIPAGILLRYLTGNPVFLHNSTFPHRGQVTCAHCTCPRRLDGRTYAPADLVTHYESEYGAAPKVEMPVGQELTFVNPEYDRPRWVGFRGKVLGNPAYEICRSQQDVEIRGDWQRLRSEARDSHWIMVYGDRLREAGYAARKLGLEWTTLEPRQPEAA